MYISVDRQQFSTMNISAITDIVWPTCVCVYVCTCVCVCLCGVYVYVYLCVCVTGPDYWGRVNHEWTLCSKGLYQSPVDISPRTLVYDPNLRPVRLDQHRVS